MHYDQNILNETSLSERIEHPDYISVEEMYRLVDANIRKIYEAGDGIMPTG